MKKGWLEVRENLRKWEKVVRQELLRKGWKLEDEEKVGGWEKRKGK